MVNSIAEKRIRLPRDATGWLSTAMTCCLTVAIILGFFLLGYLVGLVTKLPPEEEKE